MPTVPTFQTVQNAEKIVNMPREGSLFSEVQPEQV